MLSISNLTLCLKDELDGVIDISRLEPVLTLDGIEKDDERGIVSRFTVFEAVMSDTYVPPYVPLNSILALIVIDFVPSVLCGTSTV